MPSRQIVVVDASGFIAAADAEDRFHGETVRILTTRNYRFVAPAFCAAEAAYMIGTRWGPRSEGMFLRSLESMEVHAPGADDWRRIAGLVEQYADMELGGADASLVVLAERLDTDLVLSLDRRHLRVVRPTHCVAFRLLPDDIRR